jgi:bacillithiol system protein YtxJ
MALSWKNLDNISLLDKLVEDSKGKPLAIFKHSTTCSISAMAKMRLENNWNLDIDAYYLDLKAHRNISNEIANRFSVHHESPQLILLKDGEVIYDASHFDISVEEIAEELAH